jgi:N-glycosylase/DNA lyase
MHHSIRAAAFDLARTLGSGQFFRWTREGDSFYVHCAQRLFRVRQQGETLEVAGADRWFVESFFALDHDAPAIERALRRDRKLWPALDAAPGLRILRQDPWECTAAFITSIASNIPRITANVADIARTWGTPLQLGRFESWTFPRPGQIGDEAGLRRLRLGFRAKYLVQAERLARSGLLQEIAELPYEEARETLQVLPGVAEKVADCVLLFAYGQLRAFPVDTWIRKVMTRVFFGGRRRPDRAIRAFAEERWGDLAGYAQQYLYVWSRRNPLFTSRARASAASRA